MIAALCLFCLLAGAARALAPPELRGAAAAMGLGLWAAALGAGILAGAPAAVDLFCAAAGVALCFFPWPAQPAKTAPAPWLMRALAAATGLAAAAVFIATLHAFPDGGWDAMMIWNLRARIFATDPQPLLHAFDPVLYHTDYPLLVPGAVARLWMLSGDGSAAPVFVSAFFALACALSLWALAKSMASGAAACLAVALLFGAPVVARVAAWQYADVPLALFVLLAAGLSALGLQRGQPRAFVAAGVAAGLAAWTKNEGLLHLLCIGAAVALFAGRRAVLLYAGGALPLLALCAAFKLSPYPATNDLFAGSSLQAAVERLSDLSRWSSVAQSFLLQPFSPRRWGFAAWAVAPLLFFRRGWSPAEKLIWTAVALGLAGSFSVYLLTPRTLAWHLETSLDRLYLHVFPAALLAFSAGIARLHTP